MHLPPARQEVFWLSMFMFSIFSLSIFIQTSKICFRIWRAFSSFLKHSELKIK